MNINLFLEKSRSFFRYSVPEFLAHPLWIGHRHSPFLRFARLQAFYAFGEKHIYMPWIGELMLPIRHKDSGLTGNYYLGLHEFRDMAFAAHLLRPGDLFVDIGANLGSYSLIASGVCSAFSIAFEPAPPTYKRLSKILQVNNLSDLVGTRPCALTSTDKATSSEALWFSTDRDTINSFVDSSYAGEKQVVPVSTLDKELSGKVPILVKIDVEGFEFDVLSGAANILSHESCFAVIIEGQADNVNAALLSMGFVDVGYDPLLRLLEEVPHRATSNKIWIKPSQKLEIANRLSSAPEREVYGRHF